MAHSNGIESSWAMLKLSHHGTYERLSIKHLYCHVTEFSSRRNERDADAIDQIARIVQGIAGNRSLTINLSDCRASPIQIPTLSSSFPE